MEIVHTQKYSFLAKAFHWGFILLFGYGVFKQVDELEELADKRTEGDTSEKDDKWRCRPELGEGLSGPGLPIWVETFGDAGLPHNDFGFVSTVRWGLHDTSDAPLLIVSPCG